MKLRWFQLELSKRKKLLGSLALAAAQHFAEDAVQDRETHKRAAENVHKQVPPVRLVGVRSVFAQQKSEVKGGTESDQGQEEPEAANDTRVAALDELGPTMSVGAFVVTSDAILDDVPSGENTVKNTKENKPRLENAVADRLRMLVEIGGEAPNAKSNKDTRTLR